MKKENQNSTKKTILVCSPENFKIIKPINYTEVQSFKTGVSVSKLIKEHIEFCNTLISAGVIVKKLTPLPNCPQQTFARDLGFLLNNTIYIGKTNEVLREGEHVALESYLSGYSKIYKFNNYLEGGDLIIFNKTIFVGISSRTTKQAYFELKKILGNSYNVVAIELKEWVLHLDTVFNVVNDIIVYYPKGLTNNNFNPNVYSNKVVKVSEKEQKYLATNFLVCDHNKIISNNKCVKVNEVLKGLGVTVIGCNYNEMLKLGGSFRCCSLESPI